MWAGVEDSLRGNSSEDLEVASWDGTPNLAVEALCGVHAAAGCRRWWCGSRIFPGEERDDQEESQEDVRREARGRCERCSASRVRSGHTTAWLGFLAKGSDLRRSPLPTFHALAALGSRNSSEVPLAELKVPEKSQRRGGPGRGVDRSVGAISACAERPARIGPRARPLRNISPRERSGPPAEGRGRQVQRSFHWPCAGGSSHRPPATSSVPTWNKAHPTPRKRQMR